MKREMVDSVRRRLGSSFRLRNFRRWLGWIAIAWVLAIGAVALLAYGNPSRHATIDERAHALAAQLRCPVCQGESVADSQSDIARGIRNLIRRDLAAGQSESQISAYLQSRYAGISLSPPASGLGSLAWLAPPLLVLAGLALLATLVIDWRGGGRGKPAVENPVYLERVRAELAAHED